LALDHGLTLRKRSSSHCCVSVTPENLIWPVFRNKGQIQIQFSNGVDMLCRMQKARGSLSPGNRCVRIAAQMVTRLWFKFLV
jgi:hypothetical protein